MFDPAVACSTTHIPTVMIVEKAADLIKDDRKALGCAGSNHA